MFFTHAHTKSPIRNRTIFNVSGTNLTVNAFTVTVICSVVCTRILTRSLNYEDNTGFHSTVFSNNNKLQTEN